jgi:cytochrome b pre-mRNA-processing protein 3
LFDDATWPGATIFSPGMTTFRRTPSGMFKRIFGSGAAANWKITDALYEQIVAAARQPLLYAEWNVPDTPLGRFEMIALHVFLVLHRLRGEAGDARDVAQNLTDTFFADVEHSIRELGIGDLGVPKRMKKLARMFYGRAVAYGEAIDRDDRASLAAALARNVRPDEASWAQAAELAGYALAVHRGLASQPLSGLTSGRIEFPVAALA